MNPLKAYLVCTAALCGAHIVPSVAAEDKPYRVYDEVCIQERWIECAATQLMTEQLRSTSSSYTFGDVKVEPSCELGSIAIIGIKAQRDDITNEMWVGTGEHYQENTCAVLYDARTGQWTGQLRLGTLGRSRSNPGSGQISETTWNSAVQSCKANTEKKLSLLSPCVRRLPTAADIHRMEAAAKSLVETALGLVDKNKSDRASGTKPNEPASGTVVPGVK
jgi:hypothetical protein